MTADRPIYLDCAATTSVAAAVREAMVPFLDAEWGNPSSRHARGVRVRARIDEVRADLADRTGVPESGVLFTSGGTEANNLAVLGAARIRAARAGGPRHVLVGPSEHPCVSKAAAALVEEGFEVETGRHAPDGSLDLEDFAARMREDTALVSVMMACNEHGGTYPLRAIAARARERSPRAHVHTDAVQGFGKLEVDVAALGVDSAAISAHKFHGPKGSGALLLADGVELRPIFFGGGQERGIRSGTENPAGIVGLGTAARLADDGREETLAHLFRLRELFAARVAELHGVRLLSPGGERSVLPSIAAMLVEDPASIPAEVALNHLEERGIQASAGSACNAKKTDASPAMTSLGLTPDEVGRILRFSFSAETTEQEAEAGARALGGVLELLRATARPASAGRRG
jgi:cysteine desulfurase